MCVVQRLSCYESLRGKEAPSATRGGVLQSVCFAYLFCVLSRPAQRGATEAQLHTHFTHQHTHNQLHTQPIIYTRSPEYAVIDEHASMRFEFMEAIVRLGERRLRVVCATSVCMWSMCACVHVCAICLWGRSYLRPQLGGHPYFQQR